MVRVYMDLEDETELLYLFNKYIIDMCHPEAQEKLEKLLATIEQLAVDKKAARKLARRVRRQFREEVILCHNSRRH